MSDERIAELENTILELSRELNRLVKWKECPSCHGDNYCRVDVDTTTGGNPGRMYICYDCRYPHVGLKDRPVFGKTEELLAYAGKLYPKATKFEIELESLGNQTYTKGGLQEGVMMSSHAVMDPDNRGQFSETFNRALKITTHDEFVKLYPM